MGVGSKRREAVATELEGAGWDVAGRSRGCGWRRWAVRLFSKWLE